VTTSAPSADPDASGCRACGAADVPVFYEVERVPVHSNELHASREAALARPTGALRLACCEACGFVQNQAFDPAQMDYAESYEDSQGGSARFDAFASQVVAELIEDHDLAGKRVLEIGCGRGDFLLRLVEAGMAGGVGIDPAWRPSPVSERLGGRARFIADFYSPRYAELEGDLVFCRHSLEHIPEVHTFVAGLRENLGARRPVVYFELPDTERILAERAFWDVYYEHCSYFTPGSLAALFRRCGFAVTRLHKAFGDQYLLLEALPSDRAPEPVDRRAELAQWAEQARSFAADVAKTIADWRARLDAWRAEGRRVVLWGAGSKAVGFLTALGGRDDVRGIVDINPAKQGTFQAGTGHPILAPASLREIRPDRVVLMNPIYAEEIGRDLESLGLHPELYALRAGG